MLHLTIAGNILVCLGATPLLYSSPNVPVYPSEMVDRDPALELNLFKMSDKFIELAKGVSKYLYKSMFSTKR
jgi:hypothetical protein